MHLCLLIQTHWLKRFAMQTYFADSDALVEALCEALVLADSDALVDALCDALSTCRF